MQPLHGILFAITLPISETAKGNCQIAQCQALWCNILAAGVRRGTGVRYVSNYHMVVAGSRWLQCVPHYKIYGKEEVSYALVGSCARYYCTVYCATADSKAFTL